MKIKQLLKILQSKDPNREVILSNDAEGNNYSPLATCSIAAYAPNNSYSGEVGLEELTEEDKKAGYTEEDVIKGKPAIVFYPRN